MSATPTKPGAAPLKKEVAPKWAESAPTKKEAPITNPSANKEKFEFGMPSIMIITGRTGSGKTYLLRELMKTIIQDRKFKVNFDYEDPVKRLIYVGQYTPGGERSGDEEHNSVIEDILEMSPEKGECISYLEAQQEAEKENEEQADIATILGRAGDASSAMTIVMKKIKEMVKEGDVVIFDDLQHLLGDMTKADKTSFKQLANVFSHHKGISLIYLFQVLPTTGANKNMLGNLVNNAHAFIQITRLGMNARDFTDMFHLTYGDSAELMKEIREKCKGDKEPPQFVIYDKQHIYFPDEVNGTFSGNVSARNGASGREKSGNSGKSGNGGLLFKPDSSGGGNKRKGGPDGDSGGRPGKGGSGKGGQTPSWWPSTTG
jgi:energy-coupling factor transporter ATP-binding protein EcfA2